MNCTVIVELGAGKFMHRFQSYSAATDYADSIAHKYGQGPGRLFVRVFSGQTEVWSYLKGGKS